MSVVALRNLVGGQWVAPNAPDTMKVIDPATEELVATLPAGCPADVDDAVAAARSAQSRWSARSLGERIDVLLSCANALDEHVDELAELECREMGKPLGVGRMFVEWAIAAYRDGIRDAESYPFRREVGVDGSGRTEVVRLPVGVVALIVPWNFAVASVLAPLGPLLAAGNTVVVKPSEKAPLSATRLLELLSLPPGVVNLVHGDVRAGAPLAGHPDVGLVHFTGSVAAGRAVGLAASGRLCRSVLELGGKDPVVVDAGVDPVATANAVAYGAFVNSGQICTSMERIYVHRAVAEPFVDALVQEARTYRIGDGHDPETVLGPLVDAAQRDVVHRQVIDAIAKGAKALTGGGVPDRPGFFYPATVLTDVDDSMLVMTEETFGPVAPVQVVDSFEDGLAAASRSTYGLAATVYTNDPRHAEAAPRIPAGLVWINQWQGGAPGRVYEPARNSGMTATGGHATYDAATRPITVFHAS